MQKKNHKCYEKWWKNCNKYNVTYVNKEHQATEMTKGFYGEGICGEGITHQITP